MDDVMLIKFLAGSDPRGLPDDSGATDNDKGPDMPSSPGGTDDPDDLKPQPAQPGKPGDKKEYYDINNEPNQGDDTTNEGGQTQLPNDDGDSSDTERKRPLA